MNYLDFAKEEPRILSSFRVRVSSRWILIGLGCGLFALGLLLALTLP